MPDGKNVICRGGPLEHDGAVLFVTPDDVDVVLTSSGRRHRYRATSEFQQSPDGRLRVYEYAGDDGPAGNVDRGIDGI